MTLLAALTIVTQLSMALHEIHLLIQTAQTHGRDLNDEEVKAINDKYDKSFSDLRKAIEAKE